MKCNINVRHPVQRYIPIIAYKIERGIRGTPLSAHAYITVYIKMTVYVFETPEIGSIHIFFHFL